MHPDHTLIIKTNITRSQAKKSNQKLSNKLHHQIITTCGDANAMMGTKHIDPSLCLYLGAYLMCIDNKHLKDKVPRGNGTLCQMLDVKLKHNAPSCQCKTIMERKCGQSMQQMLNGWNVNT
jgi:hypothetical protein